MAAYISAKREGSAMKILLGCTLLLCVFATPVQAQTVEFIHTDASGTPVAVTDINRNVIERSEYEPFGALLNRPISDGPGYTGHVMDAATGLTYMQQRYYDPGIGRFLSVDPVTADANLGTNFNRYWYANNSPYKFTDPDGRLAGDPFRGIESDDRPRPKIGRGCNDGHTCYGGGGDGKPQEANSQASSSSSSAPAIETRNHAKLAAAAVATMNSGRLAASGLLKFGIGGTLSLTGVGAAPGAGAMAWGAWNLRSSFKAYERAGKLLQEYEVETVSGYTWRDNARTVIVGGLLPWGMEADDRWEPSWADVAQRNSRAFVENPMGAVDEIGQVAP